METDAKAGFYQLKLLNGWADGNKRGRAIYARGDSLRVHGCEVRGNFAEEEGGGIAVVKGSLFVTNSKILGNNARERGGGIYFAGYQMQMSDSLVALNGTNWWGGGIYVEDTPPGGVPAVPAVEISHVEFVGNVSTYGYGGGMYSMASTVTLTNATYFHENIALHRGGGLYIQSGTVTCVQVAFWNDQAGQGKGIYNVQGSTVNDQNGGLGLFGGDDWVTGP